MNNDLFRNNRGPDFKMYSKRKDNFISKEQELAIILKKEERSFFIKSLRNLLSLVEKKKGKEAKATIAANIM